jgi:hypothetical protein
MTGARGYVIVTLLGLGYVTAPLVIVWWAK